jgi:hypothetical protein
MRPIPLPFLHREQKPPSGWDNVARAALLGLVGETGCGKSVTGIPLMRLLPIGFSAPFRAAARHHRSGRRPQRGAFPGPGAGYSKNAKDPLRDQKPPT